MLTILFQMNGSDSVSKRSASLTGEECTHWHYQPISVVLKLKQTVQAWLITLPFLYKHSTRRELSLMGNLTKVKPELYFNCQSTSSRHTRSAHFSARLGCATKYKSGLCLNVYFVAWRQRQLHKRACRFMMLAAKPTIVVVFFFILQKKG